MNMLIQFLKTYRFSEVLKLGKVKHHNRREENRKKHLEEVKHKHQKGPLESNYDSEDWIY
jgi:hypothetical protein